MDEHMIDVAIVEALKEQPKTIGRLIFLAARLVYDVIPEEATDIHKQIEAQLLSIIKEHYHVDVSDTEPIVSGLS